LPEGPYVVRLPEYNQFSNVIIAPNQRSEVELQLGGYSLTATVNYKGLPLSDAWIRLVLKSSGATTMVRAGGNGIASASGLLQGEYEVSAYWPEGYFYAQGITYNPFLPPVQTVRLQGDPGEPATSLFFNMPSAMIAGSVTEPYVPTPENPGPVLELYRKSQPGERMMTRPDVLGLFFFPGLPASDYRLEFTSDLTYTFYDYTLADGQEILDLEIPGDSPQP
jgi:hypothetical protein